MPFHFLQASTGIHDNATIAKVMANPLKVGLLVESEQQRKGIHDQLKVSLWPHDGAWGFPNAGAW